MAESLMVVKVYTILHALVYIYYVHYRTYVSTFAWRQDTFQNEFWTTKNQGIYITHIVYLWWCFLFEAFLQCLESHLVVTAWSERRHFCNAGVTSSCYCMVWEASFLQCLESHPVVTAWCERRHFCNAWSHIPLLLHGVRGVISAMLGVTSNCYCMMWEASFLIPKYMHVLAPQSYDVFSPCSLLAESVCLRIEMSHLRHCVEHVSALSQLHI